MMSFQAMRRIKQQITKEECIQVLKEAKRAVVSVHGEEGYPYSIPFNYYYDETTNEIYLHTALEGVFIDLIKQDPKVSFLVLDEGYKVEGDWAWYLNSVVVRGKAKLIQDESNEILTKIGEKYMPDPQEMISLIQRAASRTQIVAISIDHITGKLVHEK